VIYCDRVKLKDLAVHLGCRLEGDGDIEVSRLAGLAQAGPGDVTFLANPRYTPALKTTKASAVILGEDAPAAPCTMLRSRDPYLAFANAVALFADEAPPVPGVDPQACVAPDASLGAAVSIGPFAAIAAGARIGDRTVIRSGATIGPNARLGSDCLIHAHASIREGTIIGDRVIVQDGAVIGSDGFAFAPRPDGTHQKIPQPSIVIVEDDVEIGANTTIDRPAIGETRIRAGAKIDNLVQIAHGVTVGRNTLLASQVGIAGSATIGDQVVLGGQVGVAGHIEIGSGTRATGQSGITNSLAPKAFVSGCPAIRNREWRKSSILFRRLPEMQKTLAELEGRIAELERRLEEAGRGTRPPDRS
jgi:UDP-3-O-[3-hydroxymyristoyl] glucosamine N-acyltransferase